MSFNLASTAEILRALGSRLRTQRLAQGLPQRELAQMAGLSLGVAQAGRQQPVIAGDLDPRDAGPGTRG